MKFPSRCFYAYLSCKIYFIYYAQFIKQDMLITSKNIHQPVFYVQPQTRGSPSRIIRGLASWKSVLSFRDVISKIWIPNYYQSMNPKRKRAVATKIMIIITVELKWILQAFDFKCRTDCFSWILINSEVWLHLDASALLWYTAWI